MEQEGDGGSPPGAAPIGEQASSLSTRRPPPKPPLRKNDPGRPAPQPAGGNNWSELADPTGPEVKGKDKEKRDAARPPRPETELRAQWRQLRRNGVHPELDRVQKMWGGRDGGAGANGHRATQVLVVPAAPADSPTRLEVRLRTDEVVTARLDVQNPQTFRYALRFTRHGKVRAHWHDTAQLARYTLVDLTCAVSVNRCRYWLPEVDDFLRINGDEPYYGFSDLRVAMHGTTVRKSSRFLNDLALTFSCELEAPAQGAQRALIDWTTTKRMLSPDAEADTAQGTLRLLPQTATLSTGDTLSGKYFTVSRA